MLNKANLQGSEVTFNDYLSLDIKKVWLGIRAEPWSFWFLCGYFFFEYTQAQIIYPWLKILPWGQIFLLGALYFIFTSRESKWISNPCNTAIIIFFLHILVSSILAFDSTRSFDKLNVIANWAVMYYCVMCIVTTKKRFYVLLLLLMLACFKMSQFSAISWMERGFSFARWGTTGAPIWFGDAADYGLQLCLFLAWAVAFQSVVYKRNGRYTKIFCAAMIVTALASILATGNRGTLLGLAAMGLSALLLIPNRIRNFFLISVVTAGMLWAAPQEFLDRFDTAGEDQTSVKRIELWENGIQMGKEHPIFGVGYYNYTTYGAHYFNESLVTHNSPITVFAELGYIGLILYLYIMFIIYWVNKRTRKIATEHGDSYVAAIATSLFLGVPAYFICSIFITVPYYPFLYVQLALTASLSNITRRNYLAKKPVMRSQ